MKTLFIAVLLVAALPATFSAVFNDGGIHVIQDTLFQDDQIDVSNSTTLVIEPGAVLGGLANNSGRIFMYDTSVLIINGGTIGGSGETSGRIEAYDDAQVFINGGALGGDGRNSGTPIHFGGSALTVTGGAFGGLGEGSGQIEAYDNSQVSVGGGAFGGPGLHSGRVLATDQTQVAISGGSFGGPALVSGFLLPNGASAWTIIGCFNLPPGINTFDAYTDTWFSGTSANGGTINTLIVRHEDSVVNLVELDDDADGDGVNDCNDQVPDSIITPTLLIKDCDTGVINRTDAFGATLADIVFGALEASTGKASNKGGVISEMNAILDGLAKEKLITPEEKEAIIGCVASTTQGKPPVKPGKPNNPGKPEEPGKPNNPPTG